MAHTVGQRIRQYTLKKLLGTGGMGAVWKASISGPHSFTKNYCIKLMLPEAAAFLDHFATEARIGGRLTHSNLVNVIDFFHEGGEWFIVQEYVEGLNFKDALELYVEQHKRPMPSLWAAYVGWFAARGLHFAHVAAVGPDRKGVVHRDVSIDNILVSADGEVKVTDFGIAQVSAHLRAKTAAAGFFKGKPPNASPEQLRGIELDGRADVYQLGIVMYEMLTGVHPFAGSASTQHMSLRILDGELTPIVKVNPDVDPALAQVVEWMMHKDRDQRPATAEVAGDALLKACPGLLLATRPLSKFVLDRTAPKRSMTSPYVRPEDMPQLGAPPEAGGVILTALPDEKTAGIVTNAPSSTIPTQLQTERIVARTAGPRQQPSRRRLGRNVSIGAAAILLFGSSAAWVARDRREEGSRRRSASPSIAMAVSASAPGAANPPVSPAVAVAEPLAKGPSTTGSTPPAQPKRQTTSAAEGDDATAYLIVSREAQPIEVRVDGTFVGQAPLRYATERGKHTVTLTRSTGETTTKTIRVEPGHRYRVNPREATSSADTLHLMPGL